MRQKSEVKSINVVRKIFGTLLVVTIFFTVLRWVPAVKATNDENMTSEEVVYSTATIEDEFADNRIIILLNNEASKRNAAYSVSDFSEIAPAKVENLTADMYAHLALKQQTTKAIDEFRETINHVLCIELAAPGKQNVLNAIKVLQKREDFLYVGPDYIICAQSLPNDDYIHQQWAISNIQLNDAWNITTGSHNVTVAVLDTGIDANHED